MKKVSLFSKAMQAKKLELGNQEEIQKSNGFPQAIKLSAEQLTHNSGQVPVTQQQRSAQIEQENSQPYNEILIQKAKAHKISVEEFQKIEQSNIQQLQSMDQDKIFQMQEELKAMLGENLINMFRKGEIYEEKQNKQKNQIDYYYKERKNEMESEVQDQNTEILQSKEQMPDLIPKEFLKNNTISIRIKIEQFINELQIKLQGCYPSIFGQKFISLTQLQTLFNLQTKGSVVEYFEIVTEIFEFFIQQMNSSGQIILQNQIIFPAEVVEYLERNFQFSNFLLNNFQKIFININVRILDVLEKWFSLLIPFQWSKLYQKFTLGKVQSEIFKKYSNLLKESKTIENLNQLINFLTAPYQFNQVLNIFRGFQVILIASSELKTDMIQDKLQQIILTAKNIDFSDFMALVILNPQQQINLLQQQYFCKINLNPNQKNFAHFLDQFNQFYRKEVNIFQSLMNIIVSQLSSFLNQNQIQLEESLSMIIQTTFLLNDRSNLTQFSKLFQFTQHQLSQNTKEPFDDIIRLMDIDAPCIFATFIQKDVKFKIFYSNKKFEKWSYLNASLPQINESFLENFCYRLLTFKYQTKQIVDRKMRKNICREFLDQIRELIADDLLESAKIREKQQLSETTSKFYVYIQIIADLLEIIFYKNEQSNQIHYFIDSPAYGLYQLLYFQKSLNQKDNLNQINQFMANFPQNSQKMNYEYLFLKFIKFLLEDNNYYLQISESVLYGFIINLIQLIDFKKLSIVMNTNVSYFEKFLKKYIFDSYNSPLFTTIAFCFTHPLMKTEISKFFLQISKIISLVLDEFKNRKFLYMIPFQIPEHFYDYSQTQESVGKEIYHQNIQQLKEKEFDDKTITQWIKRVIEKIN